MGSDAVARDAESVADACDDQQSVHSLITKMLCTFIGALKHKYFSEKLMSESSLSTITPLQYIAWSN